MRLKTCTLSDDELFMTDYHFAFFPETMLLRVAKVVHRSRKNKIAPWVVDLTWKLSLDDLIFTSHEIPDTVFTNIKNQILDKIRIV